MTTQVKLGCTRGRAGPPLLALMLVATAFGACECVDPPPPNPDAPVARVTAVLRDEGGFDLVLSNLERPVRSLQVDVKLDGALATEVTAIAGAGAAPADVVEADLDAQGKDDFTVVIADTRRLNLPAGAVARVGTGLDLQKVTLSRALAVDDSGALRDVTVVVP
jgi:hypothetical protein